MNSESFLVQNTSFFLLTRYAVKTVWEHGGISLRTVYGGTRFEMNGQLHALPHRQAKRLRLPSHKRLGGRQNP